MDGVLIDSMDSHFAAWSTILKPYTNLSREEFNSWSGKATADIFTIVKKKYRIAGKVEDFKKRKDKAYLELVDKVKVFQGVTEILTQLNKLGLLLGVATSEPTAIANQILGDLGIKNYFSVIVGGEMVENAKPKPDLFLLTAKLLGVNPNKSVVLEDSPTGIEAAKAAGMKVIAINTTHQKSELQNADLIMGDLGEIVGYIERT